MRSALLAIVGLGICTAVSAAQGGPLPPGTIKGGDVLSPIFQQQWLTVNTNVYLPHATSKWLVQASANRLQRDTPGTWTFQLTLFGLNTAYGNVAASRTFEGVVMGTYDQVAGSWTPSTLANSMNDPAGGTFGLMLSGDPQGLMAVCDQASGVHLSWRPTAAAPFRSPTLVAGIGNTYVDPALCRWRGTNMLLYAEPYNIFTTTYSRIRMQELDLSNYPTTVSLKGLPMTVADVTRTGTGTIQVHSPTPILGPDGRVHGLWMAERLGNDSDQYFKADLRVAQGHEQVVVFDNTAWLGSGAIPGGRLFAANSGSTGGFYNGLHQADVAWLVGDELDIHTTGEILGAVWDENAGPNVTAVFLSLGYWPVAGGVAIPGIGGRFGLDLATLLILGTMTHADATQRGTMPIAIPNDPSLKAKSFNLQGLSVDPGSPAVQTFTNTAWLNIN